MIARRQTKEIPGILWSHYHGYLVGTLWGRRDHYWGRRCVCTDYSLELLIEEKLVVCVLMPSCWLTAGRNMNISQYTYFMQEFERRTGLAIWKSDDAAWALRDRYARGRKRNRQAWPKPIFAVHHNSVWYLARSFAGMLHRKPCKRCRKRAFDLDYSVARSDLRKRTLKTRIRNGEVPDIRKAYERTRSFHRIHRRCRAELEPHRRWLNLEEATHIKEQLKWAKCRKLWNKARKVLAGKGESNGEEKVESGEHRGRTDRQAEGSEASSVS